MKLLLAGVLVLISPTLLADSYTLVFDSKCSTSGRKIAFSCKTESTSENITIFSTNGKWFGREQWARRGELTFPLGLIKNDKYVMTFNYPVSFSGIATIVLIKQTGRFYMSTIAYSDVLREQEAILEAGNFTVRK